MAKSSTKQTSFFLIFTILLAIIPLFRVSTLIDFHLVPHQMIISIGLLLMGFMLWSKKIKTVEFPLWLTLSFKAFLLLHFISLFASINPEEGWGTLSRYILAYGLFMMLIVVLPQKLISSQQLIRSVVVFGSVAAIVTLFQLLAAMGSGEFWSDIYAVNGNFGHKNLLSSALMLSLPFAIMGASTDNGAWKKTSLFLVFLLVAEIFVLRTRGAWLAVFVAAFGTSLVFFALKSKLKVQVKFPVKILGAAFGLAVLLLVILFSSKGVQENVADTRNLDNRFVFWENTMEMVKEHPIIGVGPGNWKINFPKYGLRQLDDNVTQGITHVQRPHNDYLWVLSEAGPIALLGFLGLFLFAFIQLFKNLKEAETKAEIAIDLAVVFGLLAYMSFSVTDFPLERSSHNLILVVLLVLPFRNGFGGVKSIDLKKPLINIGILVIALFSIVVSAYRWQGEKYGAEVAQANAQRNAQKIVPAAEKSINPFFNMDNYANPIYYYSSLGKLVLGKLEPAAVDAEEGFDIAPYNIIMLTQVGNVRKAQNNLDEAMKYYKMATDISPAYQVGRFSQAEIYLQRKQFVEAMYQLREVNPYNNDPRMAQHLPFTIQEIVRTKDEHKKFGALVSYFEEHPARNAQEYIRNYQNFRTLARKANQAKEVK